MKRLLINPVEREKEDGEWETIHTFQIEGEETTYSSTSVNFKIFEVQNKLIARDPNNASKITSESVYFDGVRKDVKIPDSTGGNACGRVFPSWVDNFKALSKEEQETFKTEQKRKAGWYTFMFGEVTFPGKKPELVNYRLTGRLGITLGKITDEFGREKESWPTNLVEIKAKKLRGKEQFADLTFKVVQEDLICDEYQEFMAEITDFIRAHNENIITKKAA